MVSGMKSGDPVKELQSRVASLSPEMRLLLEQRLKEQRLKEERTRKMRSSGAIPRAPDADSLPLSISQERVWFLDRLQPGSPVYHIKKTFHLRGALNLDALQNALTDVVARHESLRTRIVSTGDGPKQVVDAPSAVPLRLVRLKADEMEDSASRLERLLREEARRPFDLSSDPMLRATLIEVGDEEFVLMLVLHHIAGDRWSSEIILRELSALYGAAIEGRKADLPAPPIRYSDYAVWQHNQLSGETLESLIGFWKQRLADAPVLELPAERPASSSAAAHGGRHSFSISDDLARSLKSLAIQERVTPYILLLSAFKALLHRSTGQADLVVGSPTAGRDRQELEPIVGMFVSTLVIRTDVSGNPSFRELIRRVRTGFFEAYEYRDVPFEELGLWKSGEARQQWLIRALFAMQNTPEPMLDLPFVEAKPMVVSSGTAKFDFSLMIYDTASGLDGSIRYDTALFDPDTIQRIAEQYVTLLSAAVAAPDQPLGSLPLQSDAERVRALVRWNATKAPFPLSCVHELVDAQTARTPDAPAVVFELESLTYSELNARADEIAHRLRTLGVHRGAFVPVLIDRSLELVVALLGVMKSGAAFVPLDAGWPLERIQSILDELGSKIVLVNHESCTHAAVRSRRMLKLGPDAATVRSAARWLVESAGEAQGDGSPVSEHVTPSVPSPPENDQAAPIYAIYTSGSTGKPKAAVIPHRGIVNRLVWMNRFFGREAASSVLQTTAPVFDSAVWQLFWPLINGGQTVIPSPSRPLTPRYVTELIDSRQITLCDFVPSHFEEIVSHLRDEPAARERWRSVRFVILGGENLSLETTHAFLKCMGTIRVVNLYGPTEASIGCIYHEVTGQERNRIPIGRPISNVSAVILDHYGHPAAVGNIGELYLAGTCLGYGYLRDDAQTNKVFVANPFPEVKSEKLYKTGDLARYRHDGLIEFVGRADRQVKIRGHRIEPGEIEAALREDPAVVNAAVTTFDGTVGGMQLAAYVVFTPDAAANPDAAVKLRDRLRGRLPFYMVPTSLTALDALPLLPGGKIDRASLPVSLTPRRKQSIVPPRTDLERTIADIWSTLLDIRQIGVYDDFFDFGGHSLLAMRLMGRLQEAFGVQFPLRRFFESATVASVAEFIDTALWVRSPGDVAAGSSTVEREEIHL